MDNRSNDGKYDRIPGSISFQEGEKFPPLASKKTETGELKSVLKRKSAFPSVSSSDKEPDKDLTDVKPLKVSKESKTKILASSARQSSVIIGPTSSVEGSEISFDHKTSKDQIKKQDIKDPEVKRAEKKKGKSARKVSVKVSSLEDEISAKRAKRPTDKELIPIPPDVVEKLKTIIVPKTYLEMIVDIKPPDVKHRAYYSERLAPNPLEDEHMKKEVSSGALAKWCLQWECKGNEFAPRVKEFPVPAFKNVLVSLKDWHTVGSIVST